MLDVDARTDGSTQPPPAGRRQLAPQRLVGILKDSSASADVRTTTAAMPHDHGLPSLGFCVEFATSAQRCLALSLVTAALVLPHT